MVDPVNEIYVAGDFQRIKVVDGIISVTPSVVSQLIGVEVSLLTLLREEETMITISVTSVIQTVVELVFSARDVIMAVDRGIRILVLIYRTVYLVSTSIF